MRPVRVVFLHGLESHPNGTKTLGMRAQGLEVVAPDFREVDFDQRIADWRRLCGDAGIPSNRAIEFELSKPGPADRDRLAILLGIGAP